MMRPGAALLPATTAAIGLSGVSLAYISECDVNRLGLRCPFPIVFDPLGRFFLCSASNFADHDNAFGLRIVLERHKTVDQAGTGDNVATHANAKTLPQTCTRDGGDGLVAQRARLGDYADVPGRKCR